MDKWQIVLVGDSCVGKSALADQFTLNCFVEEYNPTVDEDTSWKQWIVDDKHCVIQVIDIPSEAAYASLRDRCIQHSNGFFLVYSITSRTSFDRLEDLLQSVRQVKGENIGPFLLLGNKRDSSLLDRAVPTGEGEALARHFGCSFMEVSARTASNVDRAFADLVRLLRQNRLDAGAAVHQDQERSSRKKCVIL
ncbi:small GTPase superfamily [Mycena rosella]|uniref:Small GTPase superfamily n=1 Tax=Mycena rosella TaxID=1033263 RepID=A0AAD7M6T1_MYCRO|nr:small GTPase superfamily [Mycena rosella]